MTRKFFSPVLQIVSIENQDIVTASALNYNRTFDGDNSKLLAPGRNRQTIWG